MAKERRRYKRFSATAFLNIPIVLSPLPPYFGHQVKGELIDLSAGGLAMLISEMIPIGTRLQLRLKFPDYSILESVIEVKRVLPRAKKFLLGIEFLSLPEYMTRKIERMSNDYIDCEGRIQEKKQDVCRLDCGFYNMCKKSEKNVPVVDVDRTLELAFEKVEDTPIRNS